MVYRKALNTPGPLRGTPCPPPPLEMTIIVTKQEDSLDVSQEDPKSDGESHGPVTCAMLIERLEQHVSAFLARHKLWMSRIVKGLLLLAYMVYFCYSMHYRFGDEGSLVLLTGTAILLLVVSYRVFAGRCKGCSLSASSLSCSPRRRNHVRWALYLAAIVMLGAYLGFNVFIHNPQNAQSLLGIFGIVLVCFVLSQKPSKVNWHPVFWGFVVQFCFAAFTLQTGFGYQAFRWLGDCVVRLIQFSHAGSAFVLGQDFRNMGLAFGYGGAMILFGSLMGLLIHYGVIGFIVVKGGRALSVVMDTGPVESVVAVANIFIGMSQAPLLVLPYLPTMSRSELGALMTCGYASIAGDTMALFIASGAPANHLLTAAIISAPAALAIAKLLMPETEHVDLAAQADVSAVDLAGDGSQNALSAASDGAMVAVRLVVAAMTNMLAFVSLLALIDATLEFLGDRAGVHGLTFDSICGYVLFPLTFALGVPSADCGRVGSLIGIKLFATPVVGYAELGKLIRNREFLAEYVSAGNGTWHWEGTDIILHSTNTTLVHGVMSEKSEAIATYAMCGFSAFTAIGISIGALTSLCPARKMDVIKLIPPAFFAGNMASFATGAVAGLLHSTHGADAIGHADQMTTQPVFR